ALSRARLPALPDVPAYGEESIPLFRTTWFGIVAPAGLPRDTLARLHSEIAAVLGNPQWRDRYMPADSYEVSAIGPDDSARLRALDFEQGLALARDQQPDAILLDINLLGTKAVEFMQRLHEAAATEAIPIIALGANSSPAAFAKAIDAGFFRYLAKPLHAEP